MLTEGRKWNDGLLIRAKHWKLPEPSINGDWFNKLWNIHAVMLFAALRWSFQKILCEYFLISYIKWKERKSDSKVYKWMISIMFKHIGRKDNKNPPECMLTVVISG